MTSSPIHLRKSLNEGIHKVTVATTGCVLPRCSLACAGTRGTKWSNAAATEACAAVEQPAAQRQGIQSVLLRGGAE